MTPAPTPQVLCNGFANCGADPIMPIVVLTFVSAVVLVTVQWWMPPREDEDQ